MPRTKATATGTRQRDYSEYVTPSVMRLCVAAEQSPTDDYLASADYLGVCARRYPDSAEVASLARILLASVPGNYVPERRAAIACMNAARNLASLDAQYRATHTPSGDMLADADADPSRSTLAQTRFTPTTRAADWSNGDALATLARNVGARRSVGLIGPDSPSATVLAILHTDEGWTDKGAPNLSAIALVLYGSQSGPMRTRARAIVTAILDRARATVPAVLAQTPTGESDSTNDHPSLERDTSIPASGIASVTYAERPMPCPPMLAGMPGMPSRVGRAVWPSGTLGAWQTAPVTRWASDEDADELRAAALSSLCVDPYTRVVGRAAEREVTRADVSAGIERAKQSAAPRAYGILGAADGPMVYGAGRTLAGSGAPDARLVRRSRKSPRSGGIGGPCVTGRTGAGRGPSTAQTLDVAYGARTCACIGHRGETERYPARGAYCAAHDVHGKPTAEHGAMTVRTMALVSGRPIPADALNSLPRI